MKNRLLKISLCLLLINFGPVLISEAQSSREEMRKMLYERLTDKSLNTQQQYDASVDFIARGDISLQDKEYLLFEIIRYYDENEKDEAYKNQAIAWTYRILAMSQYTKTGEPDKQMDVLKKAVKHSEQSNDTLGRARIYESYAIALIRNGEQDLGIDYHYKSVNLYQLLNGHNGRASMGLYSIASVYLQMKDTANLHKVIKELQAVDIQEQSPFNSYFVYSVQSVYYSMLAEYDTTNVALLDSSLLYMKKIVFLLENYPESIPRVVNPPWTYSNIANLYNIHFPEQTDTIIYYLDKAMNSIPAHATNLERADMGSAFNTTYAYVYLREEKYALAEKHALQALSLAEQIKKEGYVEKYSDAYYVLATIHEAMGHDADALKYYKLYQDCEKLRYDKNKIEAINDITVKYEVEKKEAQITWLEEKNKTSRFILMLTISLTVVLVVIIILIIYFYRLRRKNLEQKVYESALLAELQQTELERNEEEKQLLQQKYDNLETLAGQNAQQTENLNAELQHIKQQIEQKPTQAMVEKTIQTISKSLIPKYNKEQYIEQLKNLDADVLEQGYLMADEKITNMDMKYIICFASGMNVKDISLIFNVEPASVRTVRYRIKKKFGEKNMFKFLI